MTTAFITHPRFLDHDTGPGHPECPERLRAILDHLEATNLLDRTVEMPARPASAASLETLHSPAHVAAVERLAEFGAPTSASADTVASPASYEAALLAVGAVELGIDAVLAGNADNAFCAVRPPGHHAEREQIMGFCFFNNVALGARHAQGRYGLERIAIIDWDVHHGNGTQHLFETDPHVFYFSIHQYPHYPGTGAAAERGRGPGVGATLNVPVAAGAGDAEYLQVFRAVLRPQLDAFRPDLVLISAGFDAHHTDPLGNIRVTDGGFADLTRELMEVAAVHCQGRLVSVLEGGYAIGSTAAAVGRHVSTLLEG